MWTSLGLAALLAVATGSFLLRRGVTRPGEAASLRPPERIKSALEEAMDGEPCDRAKMYDFAKELLKNGEPRVLIDRANAFLSRCGEDPRIHLQIYFAHGNLSDWDAAAADMTKLIEGDPNDSRYWSWRGLAYEKKAICRPQRRTSGKRWRSSHP